MADLITGTERPDGLMRGKTGGKGKSGKGKNLSLSQELGPQERKIGMVKSI